MGAKTYEVDLGHGGRTVAKKSGESKGCRTDLLTNKLSGSHRTCKEIVLLLLCGRKARQLMLQTKLEKIATWAIIDG